MAATLPLSLVLEHLSRHLALVPADLQDVSIAMMGNFARHPLAHERVGALFATLLHSHAKAAPKDPAKTVPKVGHLSVIPAGTRAVMTTNGVTA